MGWLRQGCPPPAPRAATRVLNMARVADIMSIVRVLKKAGMILSVLIVAAACTGVPDWDDGSRRGPRVSGSAPSVQGEPPRVAGRSPSVAARSRRETIARAEADRLADTVLPAGAGIMTSPFGKRWGKEHNGVDWGAPTGTPVFAWRGGVVIRVSTRGNYGLLVVIDHGEGVTTWYAHNSRLLVAQGQRVATREKIALVGESGLSTGPHIHFEVRINNKDIDPLPWLATHL